MKGEPHVLGVDDGPFRFGDGTVPVVGVVMRGATYVEGILSWTVEVDGKDATERLLTALEASRHRGYVQYLMLDGIAQGGFNVLNPRRLHESLGIPVLTLTRGKPSREGMLAALMAHVPDWEPRWALIEENWPVSMTTADGVLSYKAWGMGDREVGELLLRTTVRGLIPEPVRVAHMIASAYVKGESKGRA
ncbi:MAG TPA: DUF99 family protein [Candidatus Thermoplasmatota archaeon]|nr:DUF99 family protein [Candidatus Thermoplasmatota archaeon]